MMQEDLSETKNAKSHVENQQNLELKCTKKKLIDKLGNALSRWFLFIYPIGKLILCWSRFVYDCNCCFVAQKW